jgi:hypothetical protein
MKQQFNPQDYPKRLEAIREIKGALSAEDALFLIGIDRCPECHCTTGGIEYKDYSNKTIAVCGQCGTEISSEPNDDTED